VIDLPYFYSDPFPSLLTLFSFFRVAQHKGSQSGRAPFAANLSFFALVPNSLPLFFSVCGLRVQSGFSPLRRRRGYDSLRYFLSSDVDTRLDGLPSDPH